MYYNAEVVRLLDLCIFSYQLYAQTLYWPMDPYYEELSETSLGDRLARQRAGAEKPRQSFINRVHARAPRGDFPKCQGPGPLKNNLPSNPALDPTLCEYELIDPRRPGVTRPAAEKSR